MNGDRKVAFPLTLGIFLGAVLFGVQIALSAFNSVVNPPQPVRLCWVDKVGSQYRVELLGESWMISETGDKIEHAISSVCRAAAQSSLFHQYEAVKQTARNQGGVIEDLWHNLKKDGLRMQDKIKTWFADLRKSQTDAS